MKRSIITAVVLTLAIVSIHAQKADATPQPIESFVKIEYEPEWYATQAELWHKVALNDPSNDDAWINWFRATRYNMILSDDKVDDAKLADIAQTVRKQRPNSYARYMLDYYCSMWIKSSEEYEDNMSKAISMRPDNRVLYPDYVVYLLKNGNQEQMDDILKRWYNLGEYSYSLLNYAYNEMAGMEQNGIIFVNGDTPTYSKLLVKYGKDLFPDITVICMSLLATPEYRSTVSKELGISPIPEPDYQNYDKWTDDAVMHIIRESKRPCYFSTVIPNLPSFQDKLYSEGLVYKYSDKKYDHGNNRRRMRNAPCVWLSISRTPSKRITSGNSSIGVPSISIDGNHPSSAFSLNDACVLFGIVRSIGHTKRRLSNSLPLSPTPYSTISETFRPLISIWSSCGRFASSRTFHTIPFPSNFQRIFFLFELDF